jgi:phage baseplate assembly protein W
LVVISPTRLFVGYSTLDTNSKQTQFADIALINRDLLVAFYTQPSERIMMPTYGCKIWGMLFEQYNEALQEQIIAECERIIGLDTRLQLVSTNVIQVANGIQVQMTILYAPFNVLQSFSVTFDQDSAAALT